MPAPAEEERHEHHSPTLTPHSPCVTKQTNAAKEGKLAVAGPFMTSDSGRRGLFIFAVESVEEAKALTETDPVIVSGEMVAEYHPWCGSAALMATTELHERMVPPKD